jgi:hypothetical protein
MTKFKVRYVIEGEIEIEADDRTQAMGNFFDRVGFSEDDLYENLDNNPKIKEMILIK